MLRWLPRGAALALAPLLAVPARPDARSVGTREDPQAVRFGTVWYEQQVLLASDGASGDFFGTASVSGDTAVVGAASDTPTGGFVTGSAYVFVRSGGMWIEQQKLLASDGGLNDWFGVSVSVSGDTAVVGAWLDDTAGLQNTGSAYVFVRSGGVWVEQQKLVAPDRALNDYFGISVSVSGDTVVVGAYEDDTADGQNAGSAYVFVRSGGVWTLQQKLLASDAVAGDVFGWDVSVSGDTAVVGAAWHNTAGVIDAGSVYVFVRSGGVWSEQQELVAPDGAEDDGLGGSVAVSGDTVLVGAGGDDTAGGENAGSAYAFVRSGGAWSLQQKLLASDGAMWDRFGTVSVSGDTVVVGASARDKGGQNAVGAAYVFVRSGGAWIEQQKLVASDGGAGDSFGGSVSVSGGTAVVGAAGHDTAIGAAYVFQSSEFTADLAITKTDGQVSAVPGAPVTYAIAASNAGPDPVGGATVTDVLPTQLTGATWTCTASSGASCTASGNGGIADTVTMPAGGFVTYALTGTIDPSSTGILANMATIALPGAYDPDLGNNSATDNDTLTPEADLRVTKTDGLLQATPGGPVAYTIVASNPGPSHAPGANVADAFSASITGVTWTCVASGGASCGGGGGSGDIDRGVDVPVGGAVTFLASGTVDPGATGTLVNTATVNAPAGVADPELSDNAATDVDNLTLEGISELAHGMARVRSLVSTGPGTPANLFRLKQEGRSSYEIVVDGVTGDVGSAAGGGPRLQRLAADASTVLQTAVAAGAGPSRSLRFENASAASREDEFVGVFSAGCTTTCGPEDVYRIRAWDTTLLVARFNNSGTQVTVLVLQNTLDAPVAGNAYFWDTAGSLAGSEGFTLAPKAAWVLNTSSVPGAAGVGGTITLSHDAPYGVLTGKAVAVEPSTGFSFDTALEPRGR